MLLLTECPRTVDMEPSVSEDIVERGRGIYSTLSENSTRGREGGRVGISSKEGPRRHSASDWESVATREV